MLAAALCLFAAAGCGTVGTATSAATSTSSTATAAPGASSSSAASGTIKVGVLQSLSGTMSISEVPLEQAELLAIDQLNAKGGVLGKQIQPVVADGASDPATFATKARQLIQQDHVVAVFGGWTSASRKAMLPVFQQTGNDLWYPVQWEGLEDSPNIVYTGAVPNQQIIPAVQYLIQQKHYKKFFLVGSDYVFPRTANEIIQAELAHYGATVSGVEYVPLGGTDFTSIIAKIQAAKPDAILNTLNGDSNVAFFKQLQDVGLTPAKLPVMSFSIAEQEIKGIGPSLVSGDYVAWNYYQSMNNPLNQAFVSAFQAKYGSTQVTDDPMEHGYIDVLLWAKAVEKAGSTDPAKVLAAVKGLSMNTPQGQVTIDPATHMLSQVARIGQILPTGQIKDVWDSGTTPLTPDPCMTSYSWFTGGGCPSS